MKKGLLEIVTQNKNMKDIFYEEINENQGSKKMLMEKLEGDKSTTNEPKEIKSAKQSRNKWPIISYKTKTFEFGKKYLHSYKHKIKLKGGMPRKKKTIEVSNL